MLVGSGYFYKKKCKDFHMDGNLNRYPHGGYVDCHFRSNLDCLGDPYYQVMWNTNRQCGGPG